MLYLGNDNAIVVEDLKDPWASSGAGEWIITALSATGQLKDATGELGEGANIGSAITLTYYAQRDGVTGHFWVGVVEEDHAALVAGNAVDVQVTITASSDRVYKTTQRHSVVRRT